VTRALHVPVWLQLATVALTAVGHWRAGSGRPTGWLLAGAVHATWFGFAMWSGQYLLWSGALVYGAVAVRNWRRRRVAADVGGGR
jgi:hypothetical protein